MEMVMSKNGQTTTWASIHIVSCDKSANLFTTRIVKSPVQLKKLRVCIAPKMQENVMEEEGEKRASAETSERIVFPTLDEMTLTSLSCLWMGNLNNKVQQFFYEQVC